MYKLNKFKLNKFNRMQNMDFPTVFRKKLYLTHSIVLGLIHNRLIGSKSRDIYLMAMEG